MRPICHLSEMVRVNPNPNPKHGPDPNSNLNPKPTLPVRRVGLQCQDTYFPQDEMAHVVFKIIGKIIFHKAKLRGHLFSLGSNKFAGTTWRNKKQLQELVINKRQKPQTTEHIFYLFKKNGGEGQGSSSGKDLHHHVCCVFFEGGRVRGRVVQQICWEKLGESTTVRK